MQLFVKGFCDSLAVFKEALPQRAKGQLNQPALVKDFLTCSEILDAHNAINDVLMLSALFSKLKLVHLEIIKHTLSFSDFLSMKDTQKATNVIKKNLNIYGLSSNMKTKIAKAGITFDVLKNACNKNDCSEFVLLLGREVGGKPRVTTNKKILLNIYKELRDDHSVSKLESFLDDNKKSKKKRK